MGTSSVTVCVGAGSSSPGSSTTTTITKTITTKVPAKPAAKPQPKPAANQAPKSQTPKPVVITCPSAAQLASMPKSPDAAERWVQSICSPVPKVAIKAPAKPKPKLKTTTITETVTIETPGYSNFGADEEEFFPNPLTASVFPSKVLTIGQTASFTSNPVDHFSIATVLGRQAEVHFVPVSSSWDFSDLVISLGATTSRSFSKPGKILATAAVEYEVSYRILGDSNWEQIPGSLVVKSNTLEVSVGAFNFKGSNAQQGALLVGENCLRRPLVFGCDR